MRIRTFECGTRFTKEWHQSYVDIYNQPIMWFIAAKLYHFVWEKLTWRLFRQLERFQKTWPTLEEEVKHLPYTVKQDLRCFDLFHKNIKIEKTFYGEKEYEENGASCLEG